MKFQSRDAPCGPVEEFRRQSLADGIMPFLLPSGHHLITLLSDHPVEFGDFIRTVLQVGIHGDDNIALGVIKSAIQRRRFAVIASELDPLHFRIFLRQGSDDFPGIVGTSVVNVNDLERQLPGIHHTNDPVGKFGQRLFLVEQRYD